jgi:hypothetical protein
MCFTAIYDRKKQRDISGHSNAITARETAADQRQPPLFLPGRLGATTPSYGKDDARARFAYRLTEPFRQMF